MEFAENDFDELYSSIDSRSHSTRKSLKKQRVIYAFGSELSLYENRMLSNTTSDV